jgi:CBS domain-containing protein
VPSFRLAPIAVGEAMHRGVITCRPETSAAAVARMMAAHRIHSVPVVDDDAVCIGIVRDGEVEEALASGALWGLSAGEIAVEPLIIRPTASIERAVELMHERGTTHAVVADPTSKRSVGVLSLLDVADALMEGEAR